MMSKKKSRPSFELPAELEPGAQSGWVYRSGAEALPTPDRITSLEDPDTGVRAASAAMVALAVAAMTQGVMLGITIAALPWTIGTRTLRSLSK